MTVSGTVRGTARRARARLRRKVLWELDHGLARRVGELEHLRWHTTVAMSRSGPPMLFDTGDQEMGPQIRRRGGYDGDELDWILGHLDHPQRSRTVVEVGANIGTTTIPLLTAGGAARVEAWEPSPANIRLLRCNLILNDVEDRVLLHRAAASDRTGTAVFELSDVNSGDHRIAATDGEWELYGESHRRTTVVSVGRLDDHLEADPGDVGLVWVDTQGHEAQVLVGATRLLGRGIPWVIEYWPYGLTRAGGLDRLHRCVAQHFAEVIDVRRSLAEHRVARVPAAGLPALARELGAGYTDLILLDHAGVT